MRFRGGLRSSEGRDCRHCERTGRFPEFAVEDVGVAERGPDVGVTRVLLHQGDVPRLLQEPCKRRVPQHLPVRVRTQTGLAAFFNLPIPLFRHGVDGVACLLPLKSLL